jgi:FkbH-like protein
VSTNVPTLHWLPASETWRARIRALREGGLTEQAWSEAVALANLRLDFIGINALDQAVQAVFKAKPPAGVTKPVRLAILSSSTTSHLHAAIRVAMVRRGIWIELYEADYGQYLQELLDPASELYKFKPTAVLLALDPFECTSGFTAGMNEAAADQAFAELTERVQTCWRTAREAFACQVIHQTPIDVFPAIIGENEQRLAGSKSAIIARFNSWLRDAANAASVDILSVDRRAAQDGLFAWFNPALWHRSKQEVAPVAAPVYGDLLGRLIAARLGRSFKCLVLDLDNTLWGGVIGDDGLDGIVLGQGSATGEAYVALQEYAREQARRGIILAVCSKNDEANAREPFEKHPEMVLRPNDIACFVANWEDKASNIRQIAHRLNIGIDSLVFLDDNPFERTLVRQELPMVAVPEVPDDPSLYLYTLADAGYFESLVVTDEDRERSSQYQGNIQREALKESTTDLPSYLRSLEMELVWRRFDQVGLQRIVQLLNKTNQFNLTTRRYTPDDVQAVMADPAAVGLQLRLVDRFGDNGIISLIIGRLDGKGAMLIDTWLMSCRVLGRQVEQSTLNLLAAVARDMGATKLIGEYRPTAKNKMVEGHFGRLGFTVFEPAPDGSVLSELDLMTYEAPTTFIKITEA